MVQVNNLFKQYKNADSPSVNHLSFAFEKGKIIGLLGPNGAGKTTTISILCGLIKEYQGEVKVLGLDVKSHAEEIKHLLGIVPQQIALYPELSCKENLIYFGKLFNLKGKLLHDRISDLLQQFGLDAHGNKQIKHFSGGMKRRANIIASLLNNPSLLILDEPTAGVDVQSRSMILQFLRAYNQKGNSIIYTSHLLDEAEALCDEVLIIDKGEKVIHGTPVDIIKAHQTDNLESLFLKLTGNKVRD
ncbi:MAG TPA: ABC transporter ATP-binding protein [Chitinophagaceae bacterium]|nr:ABC transporter ATP-binding protein [Chitinophagaceae bacterium]